MKFLRGSKSAVRPVWCFFGSVGVAIEAIDIVLKFVGTAAVDEVSVFQDANTNSQLKAGLTIVSGNKPTEIGSRKSAAMRQAP